LIVVNLALYYSISASVVAFDEAISNNYFYKALNAASFA